MDEPLVTLTRGPFDESVHRGHVAVWHADTGLVAAWGDADAVILPRSSCKMVQALPLIETGAAREAGLGTEQLALSCASHNGAAIHTDRVEAWLHGMAMTEADLRCGTQFPDDREARAGLIRAHQQECQLHNNCSGKHAGFLTLNRKLGGDSEYVDPAHPVQQAVRAAFEEVTGEVSPGYGVDGCSAPNFATRVSALARGMAAFAAAKAEGGGSARERAMSALFDAMVAHPELVAGEGRACTRIMRACGGRVAVKTGAEGVFIAIIPEHRLGIALKISDGTTRGAEAVIAGLLGGIGVLESSTEVHRALTHGPITSRRGLIAGEIRVAEGIANWRP